MASGSLGVPAPRAKKVSRYWSARLPQAGGSVVGGGPSALVGVVARAPAGASSPEQAGRSRSPAVASSAARFR